MRTLTRGKEEGGSQEAAKAAGGPGTTTAPAAAAVKWIEAALPVPANKQAAGLAV